MRSAFDGPTLGNNISWSSVAVLRLSLPASSLWLDFFACSWSSSIACAGGAAATAVGAADAAVQVPPIATTSNASAATVMMDVWMVCLVMTSSSEWNGLVRGRRRHRVEVGHATRHVEVGHAARRARQVELCAPLGRGLQILLGEHAQLERELLADGDRQCVDIHVDRIVLVREAGTATHPVPLTVLLLDRTDHFEHLLSLHDSLLPTHERRVVQQQPRCQTQLRDRKRCACPPSGGSRTRRPAAGRTRFATSSDNAAAGATAALRASTRR